MEAFSSARAASVGPLEQGIIEGENPVFDPEFAVYDVYSQSRVVRDCNSKWEVNFF